ncbi:MAG: hypothetical protein ACTSYR_03380 [Candidatus Odinarchaeia archaeon]
MKYKVRLKCVHGGGWHHYEAEQATLDDTLECPTHPGSSVSVFAILKEYASSKNFKITDTKESPTEKNINLFGLHRKDIFNNRGELVTKEYYKNYDGTTYSDLVVKDTYDYTIDSETDLAQYRDETIEWYLEDDEIGETKNIKKYYNLTRSIKEGVKRRINLLDQAKAYGLATIAGMHISGIPNSYYWFSTMHNEVDNYIDGTIKQDLIDFIDNETETYVTQTVKDGMTDILDYWTE